MPIMPSGAYMDRSEVKAMVSTRRNIGVRILEMAQERGIKEGDAVDQACQMIAEADRLEELLK